MHGSELRIGLGSFEEGGSAILAGAHLQIWLATERFHG